MLEHEDATESSDAVNEYYDSDDPNSGLKVKEQVAEHLSQLTKRPLTRLDHILLKGFYTNDRNELENPSLLPRKSPPSSTRKVKPNPRKS